MTLSFAGLADRSWHRLCNRLTYKLNRSIDFFIAATVPYLAHIQEDLLSLETNLQVR